MDVHELHPAGHPAPESTISAGYDWCNAPAKKYRALNDRVARAVGSYGRAEMLVSVDLRSFAYLSHA